MAKKQHYKHDTLSHLNWQFIKLREKYGWAGEAKFYALQNMIALNNLAIDISNTTILRDASRVIEMTQDELQDFIQYLSTECMLIIFYGTQFTTQTLSLEIKKDVKAVPNTSLPIEQRKVNFKNALRPYLNNYGRDMLNNFYIYWTELSPNTNLMRFEEQKYFEFPNRLARWASKSNSNNGDKMVY